MLTPINTYPNWWNVQWTVLLLTKPSSISDFDFLIMHCPICISCLIMTPPFWQKRTLCFQDPMSGVDQSSGSAGLGGLIAGLVLASVASLAIAGLVLRFHQQRKNKRRERSSHGKSRDHLFRITMCLGYMTLKSSVVVQGMTVKLRPGLRFRACGWGCVRWKNPCRRWCGTVDIVY